MVNRVFATLLTLILATQALAEPVLPKLSTNDLNGRKVELPSDLPGNPTIVFIAFKQNQQPSVNAWVNRLGLQAEGGPAWVELPVVGRGAALVRKYIDNGMRSGITSKEMRARTMTLYSNRQAFNRSMEIPTMSQIYVALVKQDGAVLAMIAGDVTEAKVDKLRAAYY
jgi:hypothetical protein